MQSVGGGSRDPTIFNQKLADFDHLSLSQDSDRMDPPFFDQTPTQSDLSTQSESSYDPYIPKFRLEDREMSCEDKGAWVIIVKIQMKVSDSLEDKIKLCIQTIKLKPLMRKQLRNG